MSGVFGIIDSRRQTDVERLLSSMGNAMSHRDWYVVETHVDARRALGLGRIGIGKFNLQVQPVWDETRNLSIFLAGEFYNTTELRRNLNAAGSLFRDNSDLELLLRLYQQKGISGIRELNGAFVATIWDQSQQQLIIANDRFGLYPLFYASYYGKLAFAPEMKAILRDPDFQKQLDLTALAEYMRFQHLLGNRSFFENISLLPNGAILTYNLATASYDIQSYWGFDNIIHRPDVNFDEAVEESGRLMRRAVERLSNDKHQCGVYLSGGLDSRTILGMIKKRPVISLTYGRENCRDVIYASRIAKAAGSEHHWFNLPNGEWVKQWVDFHLDLTEGLHSWIHAHGISTLSKARELMDVNLTGWDGGTVMGHKDSIEPLQVSAIDDAALLTRLFYLFNQKYTWPSMTEAEEGLLYNESVNRKIKGVAFEAFKNELAPYLNYRPDVRGEYFYIRNHCRRLTQNLVTFTRSHVEVRFPFFDYDLFEFLYAIPASVRGHQRLYRSMIQREILKLAHIPYDHDELLPTTRPLLRGVHTVMVKLKNRFNRHLWPIFPDRHTLYADYETYLRGELHSWAEEILFDRRTEERGIFNIAFLRTLLDRHSSGFEEWTIGKIAPIMTYEMMLRKLYD